MSNLKLYEQLSNLSGIAGHEKAVRKFMREHLQNSDEIIQDKLGGIFGVYNGTENDVTIMIAAHMDEIGMMVVGITEQGFIRIMPIGGINPEVMVSQNVEIIVNEEKKIKGIVGAMPPHISKDNKIDFETMLLDIGADNKEAAIKMGVKIGQQVTPVNNFYVTEDGKKIVGKAWDDRIGCAMVLEIAEEIKKINHKAKVILGGTVQEEVGLRGATVASNMVLPDMFIAIDVSPVGDFLSPSHPKAIGKLGDGFLVRYFDPRCIMNEKVKEYFENIAEEKNIKYQYFKSSGGTDAAAAQYAGDGAIATTIGVPGRYIHTTATMVHLEDLENVKKMALAVIADFSKERKAELI